MKCYCHIHREMDEAVSAIWGGTVIAFIWSFLISDVLSLTFEHLVWWWATAVTLRLLAIEPIRFILIRRRKLDARRH
jgi:hypothetical protein